MAKNIRRMDLVIVPLVAWFLTLFLEAIYTGLWNMTPFDSTWLGYIFLAIAIGSVIGFFVSGSKRPSLRYLFYFLAIMSFILAFDKILFIWSQAQWTFI